MMQQISWHTIYDDCHECGWLPKVYSDEGMLIVKCTNCGAGLTVASPEPERDAAKLWNAGRYGFFADPFPDDPPSKATQALKGGQKE